MILDSGIVIAALFSPPLLLTNFNTDWKCEKAKHDQRINVQGKRTLWNWFAIVERRNIQSGNQIKNVVDISAEL